MSKRKATLTRCPRCLHEFDEKDPAQSLLRITEAAEPAAFNAWIRHLREIGKVYDAAYWKAHGYVYAPSKFPPTAPAKQGG
jgi:hypothetical protein